MQKNHVRTAVLAALAAAAAPAAMAQSWVLLDDFTATALNVAKFQAEEGRQYGAVRLEASRGVVSGQLRLSARGFGDNQRNAGLSSVRNGVVLFKSSAVTAMKGTITMRSVSMTNCTGNPAQTVARARLFGFFFNGAQPVAGSFINDVFAGVQLYRFANSTDASGVFRINAFVGQCLDDNCHQSATLATRDLGTVNLGSPATLSMVWNKAGKTFTFQRDADAVQSIPYTYSDSAGPEGTTAKRLEVSGNIGQCLGSRASVNMAADFDNIFTNALPATPAGMPSAGIETVDDPLVGTVN